jgi:sRNA-binding regulator protein Hfq
MDAASELSRLAEERFGELTAAEKKLFAAVANGEFADYSSTNEKKNNPAEAAKWGRSRILNADRLTWLCTDKQASQLVAHKGIQVKGTRIDGEFDLVFARLPFRLYFQCCRFTAQICLHQAKLMGLNMAGTHTSQILADGLKVEGDVFLRNGFKAEGEVRLLGAEIGGNLDCEEGQFVNEGEDALSADRVTVKGSVFLRNGFKADGAVRLLGAEIGGNLECDKSQLVNKGGAALFADGAIVRGNVFLRNGFKAEGEVRLLGAEIGGNLDCEEGQFVNEGGNALFADGAIVKGSVFLRDGFKAAGRIAFVGARIGGHFCVANVNSPESMALDVTSARIGVLHDDRESWPLSGELVLDGLEYEKIYSGAPTDSKDRIEWLRLQDGFWPQPYEQLAKVLRESGNGAGARDALVAKNKDRAERTKLTFVEKCWFRFFGPLIGYGHKPWLALPLALVIMLFGSVFFKEGYAHDFVTPLGESAYAEDSTGAPRVSEVYPVFHSFVYSMDVFVPVVDLRQADYWLPNPNRGSAGWLLLSWLWVETACGWVLTTLFLVGLTGLVRT